jgi:hypothetical protein
MQCLGSDWDCIGGLGFTSWEVGLVVSCSGHEPAWAGITIRRKLLYYYYIKLRLQSECSLHCATLHLKEPSRRQQRGTDLDPASRSARGECAPDLLLALFVQHLPRVFTIHLHSHLLLVMSPLDRQHLSSRSPSEH